MTGYNPYYKVKGRVLALAGDVHLKEDLSIPYLFRLKKILDGFKYFGYNTEKEGPCY